MMSARNEWGGYSGGMNQRLGLAIALAGSPTLLIVDEPTAGLDPAERNRLLNLLADIGEEVVVILSTHLVEDVRELRSQMAIINKGQVVVQGEPERILNEVRRRIWRLFLRACSLCGCCLRHSARCGGIAPRRRTAGAQTAGTQGDSMVPIGFPDGLV